MRVLVICQYYAPEPFRIADICESLVKEGHAVDVVTSFPNYPSGNIYKGYRNARRKDEIVNGVNVHRVFTVPRKKGAVMRMVNYYAYSIFSSLYIKGLKKEYDVVFVYQLSPVLMARAAMKYKKKYGKRILLYCLDLWPDSLAFGGIKKGSTIYNYYGRVSEKIYKEADKVLVSSQGFKQRFDKLFKNSEKTDYVPQYAEEIFIPCEREENEMITLTYAGNIGSTQSVETILYAAEKLQDKNIKFSFYGDGSKFEEMKRIREKFALKNVEFFGRRPVEDMPRIYAESDALIVSLKDAEALSSALPGKIQSYMAAGRPILASVTGEVVNIIKEAKCGFCSPAEDVDGLVKIVEEFISSDKKQLANNSRKYYVENFSKDVFMKRIQQELEKLR